MSMIGREGCGCELWGERKHSIFLWLEVKESLKESMPLYMNITTVSQFFLIPLSGTEWWDRAGFEYYPSPGHLGYGNSLASYAFIN